MSRAHQSSKTDSPQQWEGMFKKACPESYRRVFSKAAAILMRGAYSQYMSANVAKSDRSVSPKTAKGRPCLCEALRQSQRTQVAAFFNIPFLQTTTKGHSKTPSVLSMALQEWRTLKGSRYRTAYFKEIFFLSQSTERPIFIGPKRPKKWQIHVPFGRCLLWETVSAHYHYIKYINTLRLVNSNGHFWSLHELLTRVVYNPHGLNDSLTQDKLFIQLETFWRAR